MRKKLYNNLMQLMARSVTVLTRQDALAPPLIRDVNIAMPKV